jgi:stage V sporulation protein SpoVS
MANVFDDSIKKEVKKMDSALKVKADEPNISSDERKKRVKKLAGAVSHSLRSSGEVNVRCFGNPAIAKGAKAIAIARKYIDVQGLGLACSPAYITTETEESKLTGICFVTFTSTESRDVNPEDFKNVLMVKADPKDISGEERKIKVKKLAGAIAHGLEEDKEVFVRCFGSASIGKAAKALAIARGYTATRGPDLYCWPTFIMADIGGQERTGIGFMVYTNETF